MKVRTLNQKVSMPVIYYVHQNEIKIFKTSKSNRCNLIIKKSFDKIRI